MIKRFRNRLATLFCFSCIALIAASCGGTDTANPVNKNTGGTIGTTTAPTGTGQVGQGQVGQGQVGQSTNTAQNTQAIQPSLCGNGTIDGDEECDGDNVGDATCESLQPGSVGEVYCESCKYDISMCTSPEDGSAGGTYGGDV